MTYQVVFCGSDGAVIASDRLEGQFRPDGTIARGNDITKLKVSGEFAWAFSGGVLASMPHKAENQRSRDAAYTCPFRASGGGFHATSIELLGTACGQDKPFACLGVQS
jgi:hypothetical protein